MDTDSSSDIRRTSAVRRLVCAAAMELRELIVGLLIMLPVICILFYAFSYGGGREDTSFFSFFRELHLDVGGYPILERLLPGIGVSARLVGGALLISVPIAAFLGWISAVRPRWAPLLTVTTVLSCIPVFAFGRLFLAYSTDLLMPCIALAAGDLTLSMIGSHVHSEMATELHRLYLKTARAKGVAQWRHYWRKLAAEVLSTIKPRIPFLVGGAVVVERIYNLHGLGNLAFESVEGGAADLNMLVWICMVSIVFVRIFGAAERMAKVWLVRWRPPERFEDLPDAVPAQADGEATGSESPGPARPDPPSRPAQPARGPRAKTLRGELAFAWRVGRFGFRQQVANVRAFLRSFPGAKLQFAVSLVFWSIALLIFVLCMFGWYPGKVGAWSDEPNVGPGGAYLLGTDSLGRDVLTETLEAGRKLAVPCLLALLVPALLGVPLGAYCGYDPNGLIARFVQHAADLMDAVPKLIIVLVAYVLFDVEHYLYKILPVMGFTFTPLIYHHVRDRVAALRESGFVESERMLGASPWRIILVHLLFNNCRSVVLVHGSHILGNVILMDAALDYLQLAQPAYWTWGALFYKELNHAQTSPFGSNMFAYMAPLAAIIVTACAFVLLSGFLRSILERPEFSV